MGWIGWIRDNWGAIYAIGGLVCGALAWLSVFGGVWWFASYRYELGGLAIGWLPAFIAACVAALVVGFGWPLLAAIAILAGLATAR